MKKDRLILVGPGGSGKDYARNLIERRNLLEYAVPFTTRPKRDNEIEGKDYHFISEAAFQDLINIDQFIWWNKYIGYYYGAVKHQFLNPGKFFIIAPTSINQLTDQIIETSHILYFKIPENIRRKRMLDRKGNVDSVERRIKADRKDFKDYFLYDQLIENPEFTLKDLEKIINENVKTNA